MPTGHRCRAIDSASAFCAIFAGAKAAVPATPRRDAVAPTTMIAPCPRRRMAGIACRAARKRPSVLTRHARSKSSGDTSSIVPQTPRSGVEYQHVQFAEFGADPSERSFDRGRI